MDSSENPIVSPLSPQITRDYNVVKLLGKGGMGEVYLAEQIRVGRRRVALKVLNRSCSENPDVVKRFENEAASAGRINHRNVVVIYESRATEDGQLYVAMEYIDGQDLRHIIEERRTLPLDMIGEIVGAVCAGLGAAHDLGIVHRDIKPDNIMLAAGSDGSRVIKVLDFGIARLSEPGASASQTKSGIVMGTPHYMSPEQAMGNTGDKIDARSDIYSLGMVVYQMLTGRVAFESDSWMRVMYKHVSEEPEPPSHLRPDLPYIRGVEPVVLKSLRKDREERQQSAAEFALEFEQACARVKSGGLEETLAADYGSTVVARSIPFKSESAVSGAKLSDTKPARGVNPMAVNPPVGEATSFGAGRSTSPAGGTSVTVPRAGKSPALRAIWGIASLIAVISAVLFAVKHWESKAAPASESAALRGVIPALHSHAFSVFTLNAKGQIADTKRVEVKSFTEDLGNGASIEMEAIPAGHFLMGIPNSEKTNYQNESPAHEVSVPAFYLSRFEVTEGEWTAVAKLPKVSRDLNPNPSAFKGNPRFPVQNVSWWDAEEFCARLSKATGRTYHLPTEAEWEYACRAGTTTPFNLGETITSDLVNYDAKYPFGAAPKGAPRQEPVPVGSLGAPNAFGLSDMHGNVSEWCADGWHDNYKGAPTDGSNWEAGANMDFRVVRGGSWYDAAEDCRSAVRYELKPDVVMGFVGFRVAIDAQKQ